MRGNDKVLSFEERLLGCMHYCGNKNAQYEVNKAVHFYEGEGAGDGEDEEGGGGGGRADAGACQEARPLNYGLMRCG